MSKITQQLVDHHSSTFLKFINQSPSPFHAVHNFKTKLISHGFIELKEKEQWDLKLGGKYFFTRNQSTLVGFAVGQQFKQGNGVSIVAAHTDSPCLKLKPVSKKESQGYLQVGVQTYGGGIWHTWFDRDLGLAGRVMVKSEGGLVGKLVNINRALLRIPTLAIHLDRSVNEKLEFNKETHLLPVLATISKSLNGVDSTGKDHHPELLALLADSLNTSVDSIVDFELCLYDVSPSALGGINNEFILSARLDNLFMSYTAVESLLSSIQSFPLENETQIRMICLYDNEEVGSVSAYGADSHLTEAALRRIHASLSPDHTANFERSIQNSYMISADMAHAVHPNYPEKHEADHRPKMHGGVVIKINANQRYATTSATTAVLQHIADINQLPLQKFVVRNDCACGSTIGPILSAKLGLQTIDVGCPQLSMHSIREMAGVDDLVHACQLFEEFFGTYSTLQTKVQID